MQLGEVCLEKIGIDIEADGYVVNPREGVVETHTFVEGLLDILGTYSQES